MITTTSAIAFSYVWPVVLVGAFYLFRNYIEAWIKRRAEHTFDEKLATLRSELQKSEAKFTADLQAKQNSLDSIRDAALSGSLARRTALENRRLVAAEHIWNGVLAMGAFKLASTMMGAVNFEEAAKLSPSDPKVREMFSALGKAIDLTKIPPNEAAKQRPFVTLQVWAYYSAYSAMVTFAAVQMKSLEFGVDGRKLLKSEKVDKLVATALPHYQTFVEQYGPSGYHLLLDELEDRLLVELKNMLEGKESDAAAIENAASIIKAADSVRAQNIAATSVSEEAV